MVSFVFSASSAGNPSASVGTDIVVADNEQNPALPQRLAFVHKAIKMEDGLFMKLTKRGI